MRVIALNKASEHRFSKTSVADILLIKGIGIQGDAHAGATVKHRSRVAKDPSQPNLRQIHLLSKELIDQFNSAGFDVLPGALGENITTIGIDLHCLGTDTCLKIGEAHIQIKGLRNPCQQIENFQPGLLSQTVSKNAQGNVTRLGGIMGIVIAGGSIKTGDAIEILDAGDGSSLQVV
jgi:MOSC domain-containing protein YiiM